MEYAEDTHGSVVMLDVGERTGALVVRVSARLAGAELELSPAGRPATRTHTLARRRHVPGGTVVAAVFPSVPAGDHDVWGPDGGHLTTARVAPGVITEIMETDER